MVKAANPDGFLRVYLTDISKSGYPVKEPTMVFVLKGYVAVIESETSTILNESDVAFLHPGDRCVAPDGRANMVLMYEFEQDTLDELVDSSAYIRCNSVASPSLKCENLRVVLANCAKHVSDSTDEGKLLFRADSYLLLHLLATEFRQSPEHSLDGSPYDERISAIRRYIRQNHRSPLTIQNLADHLYLTPQYLSRFMKSRMGVNFIDYLSAIRLDGAVRELLKSDDSITQIAYASGFPNMAAFNREFKRKYGTTPRAYREQQLSGIKSSGEVHLKQLDLELAEASLSPYMQLPKSPVDSWDVQMVDVNVQSPARMPLEPVWMRVINLGFATDMLSFDFQQQLTAVQHRLRFRYARIEGIFDASIIDRIPNTTAYNYSSANKILDFLTSIQLTPFLELSPKPRKINISTDDYVHLASEVSPMPDEQHMILIRGLLNNCINRYGQREVEKWQFECWATHNKHLIYSPDSLQHYVRRFIDIYQLIKSLLPGARIGGPGFNLSADLDGLGTILDGWRRARIMPDFLSVYAFHMEMLRGSSSSTYFTTNTEFLRQRTSAVKSMLSARGLSIPLYVTQWNFDFTSRNFLNDSLFKSAFVAKNVIDNAGSLSAMGYWLFSDLTASYKDTHRILFGGNGLVSIDGLPKPAYHAFEALSRLGRYMLAQGDNYIVTTNGSGDYQLLMHNYHHPLDFYCLKCDTEIVKENINEVFGIVKTRKIAVRLDGVTPGAYRIKQFTVNRHHGSVLDQWNRMLGVDELSPSEIAHLQHMSAPDMSIWMQQSEGELTLEIELDLNEVRMFDIRAML